MISKVQIFWWTTYQLGFFAGAWALFHYMEFAVTAGWNRERCSIDCESLSYPLPYLTDPTPAFLLNNGISYHIANVVALAEYLITLYFWPSFKSHRSVSLIGN